MKRKTATRKRPTHWHPPHVIKAWAVVNIETGRIALTDLGGESWNGTEVRETPCIYMTRRAAMHFCRRDERIVRVAIQEIRPNNPAQT